MKRQEILDKINSCDSRYVIPEIYNDVELDVEVKGHIGIVRSGGQDILVMMDEADANKLL